MTSKAMAATVVSFVVILAAFGSSVSAVEHSGSNEFLVIDNESGESFASFINITGKSSIAAAELVWTISEVSPVSSLTDEVVVLQTSSIFTNVTISNDIYDWELTIPANAMNCTCLFSIASTDETLMLVDSIILFIGSHAHFPIITYIPSFQTYEESETKYLEYNVTLPSGNYENNIEPLTSTVFKANVCQFSGNSCITEWFQVQLNHSVTDTGNFLLAIDNSQLGVGDGNYNFEIFMRDSFLRYSNADVVFLTFDTSAPDVVILGAELAQEMNSEVYSAIIDDGYENSLVALTWTITEPSGLVRGVVQSEIITNTSVKIEFNQSGEWNISVLAVDSVGFFTKRSYSVVVENLPPEIHLEVSSGEFNPAGEIIFRADEHWFIDASLSLDTLNDVNDLSYVWKVDDLVVHSGANLSHEYLSIPGDYQLILEVTDTDGAISHSTINLGLYTIDETTSASNNTILIASISVILLLLLSIGYRLRKPDSSFNLPKWGK